MKPALLVIAGPNGAGKTTITTRLRAEHWSEGVEYLNPDDIARDRFGDWNSPEATLAAARWTEARREELLVARAGIAFETVFSTDGKVSFVQRAREAGYFVRVFFIGTADPRINAARVAGRILEGGHGVPIEKIISRYQRSMANLGWGFDATVLVTIVVVIISAIRNGDTRDTQAQTLPTPPGVSTTPQTPSAPNTYSDVITNGRLLKETPMLYPCSLVADADVAIECVAKHFKQESANDQEKPAKVLGGETSSAVSKHDQPADVNDQKSTRPLVFMRSFRTSMRLAMARSACNQYRPMSEVVRCAARFLGPAKENLVAKMQLDSAFTQLARLRTSNGRGNAR